jgi:disulfide bond formation protein DsbB
MGIIRAEISERIGMAATIVGFMMMALISSMHFSLFLLLPALAATWAGMFLRSRARKRTISGSERPL